MKILNLSENLYNRFNLKRVYYSAYIPVNNDKNLPEIKQPPTLREHRLYQSDWLLRFYGFKANEILNENNPNLDINFDPKTSYALNNIDKFPVEINLAPFNTLIRVPGIGIKGAKKIVNARKLNSLDFYDLKKMGIVIKRAQFFITCKGKYYGAVSFDNEKIRKALTPKFDLNILDNDIEQLSFFTNKYDLNNILTTSPQKSKILLLNDYNSSVDGDF